MPSVLGDGLIALVPPFVQLAYRPHFTFLIFCAEDVLLPAYSTLLFPLDHPWGQLLAEAVLISISLMVVGGSIYMVFQKPHTASFEFLAAALLISAGPLCDPLNLTSMFSLLFVVRRRRRRACSSSMASTVEYHS